MSFQGNNQNINVQMQIQDNSQNQEFYTKLTNSFIEKQRENNFQNMDKQTLSGNSVLKESNSTSLLTSKDLEIFNNLANKLTNSTNFAMTKKKKSSNNNGITENIKSVIDNKNKEIEIYNKINNFSIKYTGDPMRGKMSNSSFTNVSTNKKNINKSLNKSNTSRGNTPNKKQILNSSNNSSFFNINNLASSSAVKNSLASDQKQSLIKNKVESSTIRMQNKNYVPDDDYENCVVSDDEDHLPDSFFNSERLNLNRSITVKPKPGMVLQKHLSDRIIIEEESAMEDKNTASKKTVNLNVGYAFDNKSPLESQINLNNNSVNFDNVNILKEKNNNSHSKDLMKSLNNMELEMNKSSFNNLMNSKSNISNINDLAKHYENYDLTNLNYDLVKEYSHLKIDKNEEFMKRMLFDIFKRQTKEDRLDKILEKNKVKLNENDRIKTFNRLIEDANRRLEAQEKIDDLKAKLQKGNEDEKNYSTKEWEEIYQQRFLNYQSHVENKVKEKQNEKERIDKEKEIEIINNCKTIKKPKKIVDDFFNRMYDEARIRQIKQMKHKAVYENEEKNLSASINLAPGFSNDCKTEKNNITEYKNKVDKTPTKYNFQNGFNTDNINENEKNNINPKQFNKLSTIKEISDKSFNFSQDMQKLKETPIKRRSISKDNLAISREIFDNTPLKNKKESEKKLSNTDMNNMRFECNPSESKKNLLRNSSSILSVSYDKKGRENTSNENILNKTPEKKVVDYSTNLFSANLKNLRDIKNNIFDISDEDIIPDVPKPYKIRAKKPSYKIVPIMFSNTRMKFLPDHVAFDVVDNILNPKIYDD